MQPSWLSRRAGLDLGIWRTGCGSWMVEQLTQMIIKSKTQIKPIQGFPQGAAITWWPYVDTPVVQYIL
jgi:hypothetical protein